MIFFINNPKSRNNSSIYTIDVFYFESTHNTGLNMLNYTLTLNSLSCVIP